MAECHARMLYNLIKVWPGMPVTEQGEKMRPRPVHLICALFLVIGAVGFFISTISAKATSSLASSVTWTDDFNSTSLDSRWFWIREDPDYWSLTTQPGFLQITTQSTFSQLKNLLVQNMPTGDYEVQTRVLFTPTEDYQMAGLAVVQDDNNYLTLSRVYCDRTPPDCVGNGIYFLQFEGGAFVGNTFAMTTTVPGEAYLKLLRTGNVYTGYFSTDGTIWTLVGVHTINFTPTMIGLGASNQIQGVTEIPAGFDFFTLIDNGFHLYLPLILK